MHWGVVLQIFNVEKENWKDPILVDAGKSSDGKLKAKLSDYEEEENLWTSDPGFAETDIPLSHPVPYSREDLQQFIDRFNNSKKAYHLVIANCQEFVCELMTYLKLEKIWSRLERPIQATLATGLAWSAASSASAARPLLEMLGKEALKGGVPQSGKEALKNINLVGGRG